MIFTPSNGEAQKMEVYTFKDGGGVGMGMYNTDEVGGCHGYGKVYRIIIIRNIRLHTFCYQRLSELVLLMLCMNTYPCHLWAFLE